MVNDVTEQIIKDVEGLSTLPQTLAEILVLFKDENYAVQDLTDLLRQDPGLTAKILRIANSALYSPSSPITTIKHAVNFLGRRVVWALTLSTSIYDMTRDWEIAISRIRYWKHSLQVAIAARLLAEQTGGTNSEEAFVCGLLHDIGFLLLEKTFPVEVKKISAQAQERSSICDLEEMVLMTNHAQVGRAFLEHCNLPPYICMSVADHHNARLAEDRSRKSLMPRIIALGNIISPFTINPHHISAHKDLKNRNALIKSLDLDPEIVRDIEKSLLSQTLDESKYLEMDIGSADEVVFEANRIIYKQYVQAARGYVHYLRNKNGVGDEGDVNTILFEANQAICQKYLQVNAHLTEYRRQNDEIALGEAYVTLNPGEIIGGQYLAMESLLSETKSKADALFSTKSAKKTRPVKTDLPAQASGYASARIKDHDLDEPLNIGETYLLESGIHNCIPEGFSYFRISLPACEKPIRYTIRVTAEDMEIQPESSQYFDYDPKSRDSFARFVLRPLSMGRKEILVEYFYESEFIAQVDFEVKVEPAPSLLLVD